jgi:hypothetical protein
MSNPLLGQYVFYAILALLGTAALFLLARLFYPLYLTAPRDIIKRWWQASKRWCSPLTPEEQDWEGYSQILESAYELRQLQQWLTVKPAEMDDSAYKILQGRFNLEASRTKLCQLLADFLLGVAPERLTALASRMAESQAGKRLRSPEELHEFLVSERMLIRTNRKSAAGHLDRLDELLGGSPD